MPTASKLRLATTLLLALMASACSSGTLTQRGEAIRIVKDPKETASCQPKGKVFAKSHGLLPDSDWTRASNSSTGVDVRNRAAELGADTLLLTDDRAYASGSSRVGLAYLCGPPRAPASVPAEARPPKPGK